ncbi:helix-turn-helix domain-containing protein [Bacillus licheniformis]|uniref:helix-turn-helix domain-containing protein n=1 Tax=Bacillus licheniformis TaxID=1402 RepID=UPI0011A7D612|nr:helix-turn-helix transcriptional regulator [Bacillus licheniformis]MBS2764023.1 helix-turn-helix transcriptional regulator [Bacillus licheniformis]MED4342375.1 helix-turn-helix transcriptional regulator [Bacillus licheniformis]TWL24148.1 HTH-type transcriptional regulator Xre [Bacillus licheniformis]
MLGKRITSLRKQSGLTQEELAKKLNITRSALSQYELGTREPNYDLLIKIADFFEVSTDYLLRGTDPKVQDKIFEDEAKRILNDPKTFIAARDGEITQEILDAALEIITEQLKEGGKKKSD